MRPSSSRDGSSAGAPAVPPALPPERSHGRRASQEQQDNQGHARRPSTVSSSATRHGRTAHAATADPYPASFRRPSDPILSSSGQQALRDELSPSLPTSHSEPLARRFSETRPRHTRQVSSDTSLAAMSDIPHAAVRPSSQGGPSRPSTGPGPSSSRGAKMLRLPSLASIAKDLPDFPYAESSPRQHVTAEPGSASSQMRAERSRGSASSRGSSPHSNTSSAGSRRRGGLILTAQETPNTLRTSAEAPK